MRRLAASVLMLGSLQFLLSLPARADDAFANRDEALKALTAPDPAQRAEAIAWIAQYGQPADDAALRRRLTDENPFVRRYAEQGLWLIWGRSGDEAVDALMEKGIAEMQAQQFKASIATFSEVIRRKPAFAEGWNSCVKPHSFLVPLCKPPSRSPRVKHALSFRVSWIIAGPQRQL